MWGKVTIISHSIEISITRGGEEMVCAYLLGLCFSFSFFSFSFCHPAFIVLGTKSLM